MTAIESPQPFKTIFPSSTTTSTATTPRTTGCRTQGYKKIRWRKYDPGKKSVHSPADQFVQWQPPSNGTDEVQDEEQPKQQRRPRKRDVDTGSNDPKRPSNKALVSVSSSPMQPLPLNGTRVDPFTTYPIKVTETVQDTMDYFTTICMGFTNTEHSLIPGPINPHLSLLLPYALQHAVLFESIVSVCRASVLLSLGRSIWDDYAFVHHRGSTIAALNDKLKTKDATDDAALLTVTMLMTLEYLSGNQHGVLMHCRGLEKMLEVRGPLTDPTQLALESQWTKFVRHGLTAYKALGSFVTGQAPDIPRDSMGYLSEVFEELHLDRPLSYPETPFPPDLCVILSRLPSGLSDLGLTGQISVQMINLLASIQAAVVLFTSQTANYSILAADGTEDDDLPLMPESSPYHEERKQTLMQTMLSSLQRMSLTTARPVEYQLTSGLLAFLFQLRALAPVNLFYDPILRKFITTFPNHPKPTSIQKQHSIIWASMAVAGSLALRVVPMPDSHTVLDYALETYPDARSWKRLEPILRSYFWTEQIGAHWKQVWDAAMRRRDFLIRRSRQQVLDSRAVSIELEDEEEELGESSSSSVTDPGESQQNPLFIHPGLDLDSEEARRLVREHVAGAPRAMMEMSQAMGLCPFRPRLTPAESTDDSPMTGITPGSSPHSQSSPGSTMFEGSFTAATTNTTNSEDPSVCPFASSIRSARNCRK